MRSFVLTYLLVVAVILGMTTCTQLAVATPAYTLPEATLVFRSDFNETSSASFIEKVMLYEGKVIHIYLDSPGGSVFALDQMIQAVRATGKKTICYTGFSASASFMFFQAACDVRVVMANSVLMHHQASTGYKGEVNRIESFKKLIDGTLLRLDTLVAKRMRMSVAALRELIKDDVWVSGAEAREYKMADKVMTLRCSPEMVRSTYEEEIQIFIFTLRLTWSKCPLLAYPKEINGKPTWDREVKTSPAASVRFDLHRSFYVNFGRE